MGSMNAGNPFARNWGADVLPEGGARFRIWAEGQDALSLRIDDQDLSMTRTADGWFEIRHRQAAPGSTYSFVLEDGRVVPDPASRAQQDDVHGLSVLIDPSRFQWQTAWNGRAWEEAVIYELHVGTFTEAGTFRGAMDRLDHLAELGVTAVEIMPVAQFSGRRGWGYDGVLLYAPHSAYGTPDDFRALIDASHARGLMVLLDVVYNHFGPDGNYLSLLAPGFFDEQRHTPWGAGIAYQRQPVRSFFIENALYWLSEFRLDGLRLDAIDQIIDPSEKHVLVELAERVREAFPDRHIHLTTEDSRNITELHERPEGKVRLYTGEWNDDFHNAAHVVLTGEAEGYYEDFADAPVRHLARCLAEGFAYQGEPSPHSEGAARGHPSAHLPPTAFVNFLQNHDQVGNRGLGERLSLLASARARRALTSILLLAPSIPLLFMGEEFDEERPFFFFTDFHGDLGSAVREGRRREFAHFSSFDASAESVPDPNDPKTFQASRIDWNRLVKPGGAEALDLHARLLALRSRAIVPLLKEAGGRCGRVVQSHNGIVAVDWKMGGSRLSLRANLSDTPATAPEAEGDVLWSEPERAPDGDRSEGRLEPWSVVWVLDARR